MKLSKSPYFLGDKSIAFLGEIPRKISFESRVTAFVDLNGVSDFMIDDSALAINTKEGLILITGCGHAGICNTIDYAKTVMGNNKVLAVFGGFHLKNVDQNVVETKDWLKNEQIELLYPSHCTSFEVRSYMSAYFNIKEVKTGDIYEF